MQAVRESYADIGLMRERGLSWADISDVLAKLGVTARDNQPISPVTLRSAFFLVGNEGRDGGADGDAAGGATPRETLDAVHRAALAAGQSTDLSEPAVAVDVAETPDAAEPGAPDSETPEPEDAADGAPKAGPPEAGEPESSPDPESEPIPVPEPASAPAPEEATPAPVPDVSRTQAPIPKDPDPHVSTPQDSTSNRPWKGDRMLGTIFVLNDRGGVGKTLLSHHLMATAMLEGLQLKVVEYEVNERLNRLFGPEVVEHRRITQDFMNMMGSGDGFYEFWDQIGPELQRGGRLYDFGGNISQWFFNWAEVSGFDYYVGEGERLTFMVPVTVDLASLSTGMNTLERIATIAPKAKRVLVENGFSGPFSQLDDSQYARRKAEMVEREGVEVISMAPCTAPAWARLTGHRIDEVAQMTREDLVKLGMTPPVASRSLIIIHEWLRTMRQALSPYLRDAFNQSAGPAAKTGARQGAL
ncbi:hypothetical protein [Azospirillum argentinense]|uniref:hypothetical protein n=1 Tax=Azospirillum argentinense TaxID=2970906 RepID=UPI0032DE41BB